MSNKKAGSDFERSFAQGLYENGYWAHLLTQNRDGQPADVIAAKGENVYLIDCKDCKNDCFMLNRMESNQITAMETWQTLTKFSAWFALRLSDLSVWMLKANTLMSLREANASSIRFDNIKKLGVPFDEWVNR